MSCETIARNDTSLCKKAVEQYCNSGLQTKSIIHNDLRVTSWTCLKVSLKPGLTCVGNN